MKNSLFSPILAFVTTAVFVLSGCQTKEEPPTREKTLSTGFTMMDEGRYDEAIVYFADLAEKDDHYHVKIALASAYAGRAGIKLEEIYSFVVVKNVPEPKAEIKGVSLDKQASETIKDLARYAEQWIQIPAVTEDGREDLLAGLDVLSGDLEPGVRLYAATLRIVVLKSAILEGIENFKKIPTNKKVCAKDLVPYMEWASNILQGMSYLVMDLEVSFPEQKTQYQETRLKLESGIHQLKGIKLPAGGKCF